MTERMCCRILAPSVCIFFASLIPALAFWAQIDSATEGKYNGVHVLLATALGGIAQSIIGGQPLLIVGVAEPFILCTTYMYQFAKGRGFSHVFVPWCTWTMIWLACFLWHAVDVLLLEHGTKLAPPERALLRPARPRAFHAAAALRPSDARHRLQRATSKRHAILHLLRSFHVDAQQGLGIGYTCLSARALAHAPAIADAPRPPAACASVVPRRLRRAAGGLHLVRRLLHPT
jgi:HCO3- transporter family